MRPDISNMRHRVETQRLSLNKVSRESFYTDAITTGSWKNDQEPRQVLTFSHNVEMWDVVTPEFKRRQAAGEIFNNPMYRVDEKIDTPVGAFSAGFKTKPNGNGHTAELLIRGISNAICPTFSISYPEQRLIDNALTDAYANVSANDGNSLLWLGEMKETIKMLTDIGQLIQKLYNQTKKQRLKWAKGKLTVKEQQSLTLAILYGILPLEQQITQFMEGLFKIKDNHSRQTARGFRVSTETKDFHLSAEPIHDNVFWDRRYSEQVEISVRSGVLYDIDTDDLPWLAIIADPKQVVSTAYALARLSFVMDWFVNVGGTLAAWSPTFGTTELAAWYTVEVTQTLAGFDTVSDTGIMPGYSRSSGEGERKFSRQKVTKYRMPASRADLAIFPRFDVNLNMSKIASLVLLFAKVK